MDATERPLLEWCDLRTEQDEPLDPELSADSAQHLVGQYFATDPSRDYSWFDGPLDQIDVLSCGHTAEAVLVCTTPEPI